MNLVFCEDFPVYFQGAELNIRTMKVHFPDGRIMNRKQFRLAFSGPTFVTDRRRTDTTKSPWSAFTLSTGFRPPIIRDVDDFDDEVDSSAWR